MKYGITTHCSSIFSGRRDAPAKKNGKIAVYETLAEAQADCARWNKPQGAFQFGGVQTWYTIEDLGDNQ